MIDPVKLTSELVQCPSITPNEGGALELLEALLAEAGFKCTRIDRNGISNLFARWGDPQSKTFGFNGHTDVVPLGDEAQWSVPPFGGIEKDGRLYGRGACDMKSGVAAFVAAAIDFVKNTPPDGSIVITITGDEEADATDGTIAILDWMDEHNEAMTHCLVGEPTCPAIMGEMIKIGRRGSLTAFITATGKQGHVAYPHRALNPLHALTKLLDRLATKTLDEGTDHFDPSTLALTTIDTGNTATNVIPAHAKATLNIRFNDAHSSKSLIEWLKEESEAISHDTGVVFDLETRVSGESFLTEPSEFTALIREAVKTVTGLTPDYSTSGGTSDARFVKNHCPVVEFGLVGTSMHQIDEFAYTDQIHQLKEIYALCLKSYFQS